MASCSFSALIDAQKSSCGQTSYFLPTAACVSLSECKKETLAHLKYKKVFGEEKADSEMKLILARAGKSEKTRYS